MMRPTQTAELGESQCMDPHHDDRRYWLEVLQRLALPVLEALAAGELKKRLPRAPPSIAPVRLGCAMLESLGRLLVGIAPWLDCPDLAGAEANLRDRVADMARRGLAQATDPASPDVMPFDHPGQPLVDAAFLAQGLLRAPRQLWSTLDPTVQQRLLAALQSTRGQRPGFNNWLLFSSMIEAFFASVGEPWDGMRVDYALRQHEQWYKGDGAYGDGPNFHFDYYNSYVIHPMLTDILAVTAEIDPHRAWQAMVPLHRQRAARYAQVQERLIAPDGSFPPIGRSLVYRMGAFQTLAQVALMKELPGELPPAQVRSALTAVIRRCMEPPETFDQDGWLSIGLCGAQPNLAEGYITSGSVYLCSTVLLPLGLPPSDPFWAGGPVDWTSRQIWAGADLPVDHAIHDGTWQ